MARNATGTFLNFQSANDKLTCNGNEVRLKGINWFGMEQVDCALHGLWAAPFESIFKVLTDNDFNAVRIPVSVEGVEKMESRVVQNVNHPANSDWGTLTIAAFLERFIARCGKAGILVMLDMHLLGIGSNLYDEELWYNAEYPEARVIRAWQALVSRFQHHWNFFACDLKNEPHGRATWGDGSATDWRAGAERIGNAVLAIAPRMLIFVEGIEGQGAERQNTNWGSNLIRAKDAPVRLSVPGRLVYSPHVYGPDVANQDIFSAPEFPNNVPPVWNRQWSYLNRDGGAAVVLGEWGGLAKRGTPDLTWQRAMAEYLRVNNISSFYWCLNPNSKDTGGILGWDFGDDWVTRNFIKLELLAVACPAPTSFEGGKVTTPALPPFKLPWPDQLSRDDHRHNPTPPKPKPKPTPPTPKPNPTPPTPKPNPSPPNPVIGIQLSFKPNHSWKGDTGEVTQWDISIKNKTGAAVTSSLRFRVAGNAEVVNIWNMALVSPGVYKLPAWLKGNGGLLPNAAHKFGVITHKGTPSFSVVNKAK